MQTSSRPPDARAGVDHAADRSPEPARRSTDSGDGRQPGGSPFTLGLLLRRAHEKVAEASDAVLRPFGIERRHLLVLMRLDVAGAMSQRDLVAATLHDKASMVRIVDDLERLGLASRELVAGDRRLRAVTMTEHGREVFVQAHQAAAAAAAAATAPLTARQVAQLESLLRVYLVD